MYIKVHGRSFANISSTFTNNLSRLITVVNNFLHFVPFKNANANEFREEHRISNIQFLSYKKIDSGFFLISIYSTIYKQNFWHSVKIRQIWEIWQKLFLKRPGLGRNVNPFKAHLTIHKNAKVLMFIYLVVYLIKFIYF